MATATALRDFGFLDGGATRAHNSETALSTGHIEGWPGIRLPKLMYRIYTMYRYVSIYRTGWEYEKCPVYRNFGFNITSKKGKKKKKKPK